MAMTAAEIEKQALAWLRKYSGRPCCQHHWAERSGITSPEDEMALGSLVRTIQAAPNKYPGVTVEEDVCDSCKAGGDSSVKGVIVASEEPGTTLREKRSIRHWYRIQASGDCKHCGLPMEDEVHFTLDDLDEE